MQFGTNKVTECHLMSLVLIFYNQQINMFNVQTCEVGVTTHVTSSYCDYCSYCISQVAKLLIARDILYFTVNYCIIISLALHAFRVYQLPQKFIFLNMIIIILLLRKQTEKVNCSAWFSLLTQHVHTISSFIQHQCYKNYVHWYSPISEFQLQILYFRAEYSH